MRVDWSESETVKLIEIWGEDHIQAELEGCKRNKQVFEKIARELKAAGYERTAVQCREKIKKLRGEYKKVKDHNDETGRDRKSFVYFERLDEILGHRPATQPEHVIDTSADVEGKRQDEPTTIDTLSDEEDTSFPEEVSISSSAEVQDRQPDDTRQTEEGSSASTSSTSGNRGDKKRKRPAKEGMVEKAMEVVVSKIVKLQEASDSKMYAMEEKRMKLDERLMQMEERRWQQQQEREDQYRKERQERDDQRRREERQFQLQLMQMMCGRPSFPVPSSFSTFGTTSLGPNTSDNMYHWPNDSEDQ